MELNETILREKAKLAAQVAKRWAWEFAADRYKRHPYGNRYNFNTLQGLCACASWVLQKLLEEAFPTAKIELVDGEVIRLNEKGHDTLDIASHSWVIVDGYWVDATAGQFRFEDIRVIEHSGKTHTDTNQDGAQYRYIARRRGKDAVREIRLNWVDPQNPFSNEDTLSLFAQQAACSSDTSRG